MPSSPARGEPRLLQGPLGRRGDRVARGHEADVAAEDRWSIGATSG